MTSVLRPLPVGAGVGHARQVQDRRAEIHNAAERADYLSPLPLFRELGVVDHFPQVSDERSGGKEAPLTERDLDAALGSVHLEEPRRRRGGLGPARAVPRERVGVPDVVERVVILRALITEKQGCGVGILTVGANHAHEIGAHRRERLVRRAFSAVVTLEYDQGV